MNRRRTLRGLGAVALAAGALVLADRLAPPSTGRAAEASTLVLDRDGRVLRGFAASDGRWRLATRASDVDPRYLALLTAYEDRRFAGHPGVDPLALARAAGQALAAGRIVSGGSTLTMQAARLIEPRPRTLASKAVEIARALQLESRLDKSEILALYLTLAPFGGNVEGVRAGALTWLGKEPRRLSLAEAALLVALPQSPERLRPDRDPVAARAARDKVLRAGVARGAITAVDAAEAMAEPVPRHRLAMPFLAPHLAESLRLAAPAGAAIATSIDAGLQAQAEGLAARERAWFADGANLAIVIVDNATRGVRAWVGGADFAGPHGQVDLVRARRSPGSTLKPFAYALAFDEGWLHPETRIADAATRFADFAPRNFDRGFRGEVTARVALQQSLNVPAVAVLDRLGPARFAGALAGVGATLELDRRTGEGASLPIILGGGAISLADLTMLYAALADDGRARPLAPLRDSPPAVTTSLVGVAAARQVREILAGAAPPEPWAHAGGGRAIAYKTGTSYGFRDAWAIGFTKRWTIGVWVGRADGSARPGQYGRAVAAPILFRAFDLLPPEDGARVAVPPPAPPPALRRFVARGTEDRPWRDGERALAILFPPDGATVELARGTDGFDPLALKAEGGRGGLTWIVDGRPLAAAGRRDARSWTPSDEGFVRVVVIDEAGESASAALRVVPAR